MEERRKLLKKNTYASLIFQIVSILSGFIVPRMILGEYGSDVNGLRGSITQFLGIISFLEMGVGAVVQSSLYKPLADRDSIKANQIISSANKFFTRIGLILVIYVSILLLLYPLIVNKNFDWIYIDSLILVISIGFFSQYFFGIVDRLYLNSAQHGYIQYNAQTITLILNILFSYCLIKMHFCIQVVLLVSSIIFLIRPLILREYVNRNYHVKRHEHYDVEPITQKWSGVAQHIAAVVLDGTDVIVLTIFSALSNVSIYSVHHLVVAGVKSLTISLTNGVQALEGELWAKKDYDHLIPFYKKTEWIIHMGTVFIFTCTGILITPFISVYTAGVNDANYYQPVFATLLTVANACHCLRLPYNLMILAAGHYKQTKSCNIYAAVINVVISITAVYKFGLIGVAIGTLIAMLYQTLWMALYNAKNFIKRSIIDFLKLLFVDIVSVLLMVFATGFIKLKSLSYLNLGLMAIMVACIMFVIIIVVNYFFYKEYTILFLKKIFNRFWIIKCK